MKLFYIIIFLVGNMNFMPSFIKVNDDKQWIQFTTMTDSRDGEIYKLVNINGEVWMAENLRYDAKGSMINSANPSISYGRLYTVNSLSNVCPNGWHLSTDKEWDFLEIEHGMPMSFIDKSGWRGAHAIHLRSESDWKENGNGTNKFGFNVLPAGYYFSEVQGELEGIQGLGSSAAFWSSTTDQVTNARFIFSTREFVNKWPDTNGDSGAALSCRCVKDKE